MPMFKGESKLFPSQSKSANGGQGAGSQYTGQRPGDVPGWSERYEYDNGIEVLAPDGSYYRCVQDHISTGSFATDLGNGLWVAWAGAAIDTDNQQLSLDGDGVTLRLSGGLVPDTTVDLTPFLDNTDAQTLTLLANQLSISGGNSIDLSAYLDNVDNF